MSSMKLIMEGWRKSILSERVFGAQAILYHGSTTPPEKMIEIFTEDKFDPGQGAGALYGKGLYTVYDENERSKTLSGDYGQWVYKIKVNIHGFIIFDDEICEKVYGKKLSPMQQLKLLGHDDIIADLENQYKKEKDPKPAERAISTLKRGEEPTKLGFVDKLKKLFGPVPAEIQPTTVSRPAVYQQIPNSNVSGPKVGELTSDDAYVLSKILSKKVKGIVFTGGRDGKVAVIYDTSIVVPIAWAHSKRTNKSEVFPDWQPIDKEVMKKSFSRIASGEYTPGRFNDE